MNIRRQNQNILAHSFDRQNNNEGSSFRLQHSRYTCINLHFRSTLFYHLAMRKHHNRKVMHTRLPFHTWKFRENSTDLRRSCNRILHSISRRYTESHLLASRKTDRRRIFVLSSNYHFSCCPCILESSFMRSKIFACIYQPCKNRYLCLKLSLRDSSIVGLMHNLRLTRTK
jgi:hypothetical protein